MPRTRSLAWSELKIGIATLVALALAGLLIFMLGGEQGFFWQRYSLKTVFDNIAGLSTGSQVRLAGVQVGSVSAIDFLDEQVEITVEVRREHQSRITTESRAVLGTVSLLGESAVDITPSTRGTPIPEWGYIPAGPPALTISEITGHAMESIEQATGLLLDIRGGRGTIGRLFTDEAVYRELEALLRSTERVTAQIASGRGTLGRLTTDPVLYNELQASATDLRAITARVRAGEGSLGQLLHDPALAESLTSTSRSLEALTGRLSRGEGTAGRLLQDEALYESLSSMALRLDAIARNLSDGRGTAGQLLHDPQLYENMNQAVGEFRTLMAEIRKDPRKYLNVRVSIF